MRMLSTVLAGALAFTLMEPAAAGPIAPAAIERPSAPVEAAYYRHSYHRHHYRHYYRGYRHHRRYRYGYDPGAALFGAMVGGVLANPCLYGGCYDYGYDDGGPYYGGGRNYGGWRGRRFGGWRGVHHFHGAGFQGGGGFHGGGFHGGGFHGGGLHHHP